MIYKNTACRCGHPRGFHLHYRKATDCSAPDCTCRRYRRATRLWLFTRGRT